MYASRSNSDTTTNLIISFLAIVSSFHQIEQKIKLGTVGSVTGYPACKNSASNFQRFFFEIPRLTWSNQEKIGQLNKKTQLVVLVVVVVVVVVVVILHWIHLFAYFFPDKPVRLETVSVRCKWWTCLLVNLSRSGRCCCWFVGQCFGLCMSRPVYFSPSLAFLSPALSPSASVSFCVWYVCVYVWLFVYVPLPLFTVL